jgi:hypothetical protein
MSLTLIVTAIAGYIAVLAKEIPKKLIEIFVASHGYSFSVISKDTEIYNAINSWLLSLHKKTLENNINGRKEWIRGVDKTYFSINYGDYIVHLDKLTIMVINKKLMENNICAYDKLHLTILGKNKLKYKTTISELVNKDKDLSMITIFPSRETYKNYSVPKKSFDDIFNPNKQEIINFLDKWSKQEKLYLDHGITYKTGILLYGEAGTGKTTLCRAVASYMNYNMHIINLKSYKEEEDLINRIVSVSPKSIILFEDIDCVVGDRESSDEDNKTKLKILGTLLNIIDGVSSPNNVIFMATTNHFDKLDSALVREGRFDLKLNITNLNKELAEEMCNRYEVGYNMLDGEIFPINPSYLQSKIFRLK